jgi:hypothetical protein
MIKCLLINEMAWISSEVVVAYFVEYSLYFFSNQIKPRRNRKSKFRKYLRNPDPQNTKLLPLYKVQRGSSLIFAQVITLVIVNRALSGYSRGERL